jgi:Xaa-Pro aminopeptidase
MIFPDEVLRTRRARVADALPLDDALLLVGAGDPIPLPEGSDQTYPFRAHADYFFLTGQECRGGVIVFDPRNGPDAGWTSFVPEIAESERIWEGRTQPAGTSLALLKAWLNERSGRPRVNLGATLRGIDSDPVRTALLRPHFLHARRPKDPAELTLICRAAAATAAGFAAIQPLLRSGVSERRLQIELEAAFFRAGASRTGYGTIVGTGPNAAGLHFEPSRREARSGEFILIDAGGEIDRYVCDVTRTYVADGQASAFQRDLYAVVLSAQENTIARCVTGAEWKALHLRCAVEMVDGLVAMGILRGEAESLVEQDAHTLFYPHGLGHLVGLGVRDASGTLPGRSKDPRASLQTLRTDLPLQPGYAITVEPGLYFIPALLNDPVRRDRYRDVVNWDLVEQHLHLGGVRIEDNIVVTTGEPDVLTAAIPKRLA